MYEWTNRYDSTMDTDEMDKRLAPVRLLLHHGIRSIVWSEDALAFVHHVPVIVFGMELLVDDKDLESAHRLITNSFPYILTTPCKRWINRMSSRNTNANAYPTSFRLARTNADDDLPEHIAIHPASYFDFSLTDPSRSFIPGPPTLPQRNAGVLFPTLPALADGLIYAILESPTFGHLSNFLHLSSLLYYVLAYSLDAPVFAVQIEEDLRGGDLDEILSQPALDLLEQVRPENRYYLERSMQGGTGSRVRFQALRRAIVARQALSNPSLKPPSPIRAGKLLPPASPVHRLPSPRSCSTRAGQITNASRSTYIYTSHPRPPLPRIFLALARTIK